MKRQQKIVTGIFALGFVGLIAAIGASNDEQGPSSKPAPTVTVTSAPEIKRETRTQTVEVTPQICVDAINAANVVIEAQSEAIGIAGAGLGGDYSGQDRLDEILSTFEYDMDQYIAAAAACAVAGEDV